MGFEDFCVGDDDRQWSDLDNRVVCRSFSPDQMKYSINTNNFSLLHINTRSLKKHYDELISLLSITDCGFDVVGCSETWLKESSHLDSLSIDGYTLFNKNRLNRSGGGVCLYINSNLTATICEDLAIGDDHSDSLFLQLTLNNAKTLIIGVIYRPPDSDLNTFLLEFDKLLYHINDSKKECIILGDFNIDIAKNDTSKHDFLNLIYSSSFFPTIDTYTRITNYSQSAIDNIITNIHSLSLTSGVVISDITDHFPITLSLDIINKHSPSSHSRKVKILNEKTLHNLCEHLKSNNLWSVYSYSDADMAYIALITAITNSIQYTIPEKTLASCTKGRNPWLTKGILKSINQKN